MAAAQRLYGHPGRALGQGARDAGRSPRSGSERAVKKNWKRPKGKKQRPREVSIEQLNQILEQVQGLSPEALETLHEAVDTLAFLQQAIQAKSASIGRLRHLLFGPSTETMTRVLGKAPAQRQESKDSTPTPAPEVRTLGATQSGPPSPSAASGAERPKRKGHGRNGVEDYVGAHKIQVPHQSLHHKDRCPGCESGKLYVQGEPRHLLRIVGMAPLSATLYELERLRCNLCGEVYTAPSPPSVGDAKYDESVPAMIGMLKYGCGFPFYRLEWLQNQLGVPLPQTTQWELVSEAAAVLAPVHAELIAQAAQGDVLHNDDTTMKILQLDRPSAKLEKQAQVEGAQSDPADERTGTFTTGIVSTREGHLIALFFTGRQHAGENFDDVLTHRAAELEPPIQMCDALSRNTSGIFKAIVANCLAHARRRFVDVAENFPDECRYVLESLGRVYHHDAQLKEQGISPQERLLFHQAKSAPVMDELHKWLKDQLDEKKVEPNSGLGKAIGYMLKHWSKLTLFLREAGAPLDNNVCEQALKKAVLHRKNCLFYKTENGARVGDLYMSLIHTAELAKINPFDYLVALQRHHEAVLEEPSAWMPWNYEQALKALAASIPQPMPP